MLYLIPFSNCVFLFLGKPIRIGLQLGRDNDHACLKSSQPTRSIVFMV